MSILDTIVQICAAVAIVSVTVMMIFFIGLFIYAIWSLTRDD